MTESPTTVTLAGLVLPNVKWDVEGNVGRLERLARRAADGGADLIVAPEACLDGYCLTDLRGSVPDEEQLDRYRAVAQTWPHAPALRHLAGLAAELGVYLLFGGIEQLSGRLYNTAFVMGPEGPVGRYHKTHIGWERMVHTPGESLPVFRAPWGVYGVLICFDRQFPEAARTLALQGAQLILVPSNGMYGGINDRMMSVRAYENAAYLAFVHPLDCLIISPRGRVLAANEDSGCEEIVMQKLDLSRSTTLRRRPESLLSERRPHLYRSSAT